ncbi:MAG: hypothetical protein H6993_13585 [Pseudomonadales bacterium]|nr:hypothetical protein [Pseudomonadales bacterium]
MDNFERVGYLCLGLLALVYVGALVVGMIAVFPVGLLGLLGLVGIGALLIKVVRERLANREDDYYDRNVDQ